MKEVHQLNIVKLTVNLVLWLSIDDGINDNLRKGASDDHDDVDPDQDLSADPATKQVQEHNEKYGRDRELHRHC